VDEQATVEAACLAAALRMRQLGLPAEQPGPFPSTSGAADLDGEAACLMRVAEACARSPIVRQVRDSVQAAVSVRAYQEQALA
jgi:hypothetical protein